MLNYYILTTVFKNKDKVSKIIKTKFSILFVAYTDKKLLFTINNSQNLLYFDLLRFTKTSNR